MNNAKKISVPVCCICQKVINGDAEWIKTKRGTVLYMHRAVSYTHLTLPTICSV